jgi:predicted O-methyltransferase YrrM
MKKICKTLPNTGMRPEGSLGIDDIISLLNPESTMVEVGCYYGVSTLMWESSDKIIKIFAVDPWKDFYDPNDGASQKGNMNEVESLFDENIKDSSKIIKMKMTSKEASEKFEENSLDFVYLDGSHAYQDLKDDINNWLPKIKKNGFIAGHDIGWQTVQNAIKDTLGGINQQFGDSSWIVKVQ